MNQKAVQGMNTWDPPTPGASHYWEVECYIPTDLRFAVNSYRCVGLDNVIEIAQNTLGRSVSGIAEIEVSLMEFFEHPDPKPNTTYYRAVRWKRFSTMQDAMNTLKLWSTFS